MSKLLPFPYVINWAYTNHLYGLLITAITWFEKPDTMVGFRIQRVMYLESNFRTVMTREIIHFERSRTSLL